MPRAGFLRLGVLLVAGLFLCSGCSGKPEPRLAAGRGEITVLLLGLTSDKGQVIVSLFTGDQGFPDRTEHAVATHQIPIVNRRAVTRFQDLPYARYALSVLHDEDNDGRMASNWLGIPREGFGFSGTPLYRFGHPEFAAAAFLLVQPRRDITIKLDYTAGRQHHQPFNQGKRLNRPEN